MKSGIQFLVILLSVACTLRLNFEEEKTRVKVVSYRGETGLDGTQIGVTLASANIDSQEAPLQDLLIAQALEVGTLASLPVFLTGESLEGRSTLISSDRRLHYGTDLAQTLPIFPEDATRQYGASIVLKDLEKNPTTGLVPELLVGAPGKTSNDIGNVIVFSGVSAIQFGGLVARLSGINQEAKFGTTLDVGDLDGTSIENKNDPFQVLAVGAPGTGRTPGSVYLYRTFSNALQSISFCEDGNTPALVIDQTVIQTFLPTTSIGESFGSVVVIGELGFPAPLDTQEELVVTEPDANRIFVISFAPPEGICSPLEIADILEIDQLESPGPVAILDKNTKQARIAVGLPVTREQSGSVAICNESTCTPLPTPSPIFERLGIFVTLDYGSSLLAGNLDGQGGDDLVIGAPQSIVKNTPGAGAVFLLFSDDAGDFILEPIEQIQVLADTTPEANAAFGSSIAIIGDISGDGILEIAAGAPFVDAGKGEVLLYLDVDTPDFISPFEALP